MQSVNEKTKKDGMPRNLALHADLNQSKTRNIETNIGTILLVTGKLVRKYRLQNAFQETFRLSSKRFKRQPDTVNWFLRKKVQSKAVTIRANNSTV